MAPQCFLIARGDLRVGSLLLIRESRMFPIAIRVNPDEDKAGAARLRGRFEDGWPRLQEKGLVPKSSGRDYKLVASGVNGYCVQL